MFEFRLFLKLTLFFKRFLPHDKFQNFWFEDGAILNTNTNFFKN